MSPDAPHNAASGGRGRTSEPGGRECWICKTTLSAFNRNDLCGVCSGLTRGTAVETNRFRIPAARFLDDDVIRRLSDGDWSVLKDLTQTMKGVQSRIAEYGGVSQSTISHLFAGTTKDPTLRTLRACCDVLGIPRELAGLAPLVSRAPEEAETTNRRQFLGAGAGIGMAFAMPELAHRLTSGEIDRELRLLRATAPRLLRQNDLVGGSRVLRDIAEQLYDRADALVQHALPGAAVGKELQTVAGQFAMYAGWLHYDAGSQRQARSHWRQASYHAQLADDPMLEVYALESLSAQATYFFDRPHEGVALAQKARGVAAGWATPRLTSLLHMREAAGWAWARDRVQFERVHALAARAFTPIISQDDPDWLNFYIAAELEGLRAIGYTSLGDGARAEARLRPLIDGINPHFKRNRLYYTAMLGRVVSQRGDFAAVGELLIPAMEELTATGSWRTRRHVRAVLDEAQQSATAGARALIEVANVHGLTPSAAKESS